MTSALLDISIATPAALCLLVILYIFSISFFLTSPSFIFYRKFFWSSLSFTKKLMQRHRFTPCSSRCTASHIVSITHQSDALVVTNETALTNYHHQESIVGITIYSWCLNILWFQWMYILSSHNDITQSIFTALEILWAPPLHPCPPQSLATNHLFTNDPLFQ